MSRRRIITGSFGSLGAVAALVAVPAAHAGPVTCQGRAVTVVGNSGTAGDDVMVIDNRVSTTADTGAGNDMVCLRATFTGEPFTYTVVTGPGDDTVTHESVAGSPSPVVMLGAGADTYLGSDLADNVYAGANAWQRLGDDSDVETDVIDTGGGMDKVFSGANIPGVTNPDSISLGAGDDSLSWAGEASGSPVSLGPGRNNLSVFPGWRGSAAVVDAVSHTASVDGRPVLAWTGESPQIQLTLDNPSITFRGTDAAEDLAITTANDAQPSSYRMFDLTLGGGDDTVNLYSFGEGRLDGGAGVDGLSTGQCTNATVAMDRHFTCSQQRPDGTYARYRAAMAGWEALGVFATRSADVGGTPGDDRITAWGAIVRLRGKAGDDELAVRTRNKTGSTVVRGGPGSDHLEGSSGADRLLGERGSDELVGLRGPDRLLGGRGLDTANGGKGNDICVAERQQRC